MAWTWCVEDVLERQMVSLLEAVKALGILGFWYDRPQPDAPAQSAHFVRGLQSYFSRYVP
jgi:hypothetical protein